MQTRCPPAGRALKPTVFLDAVADQSTEQVFVAMPTTARRSCSGNPGSQPPTLTQIGQLIFMDKRIEGFWLSKWLRHTAPDVQKRVIGAVQERFANGIWHTDVTTHLPLKNVVSGLAAATKQLEGKVIITP